MNVLPTRGIPDQATPYMIWHNGAIPNLGHIRTFGCLTMMHFRKEQRGGKEKDKSEPCVNLGYDPSINQYHLARLNQNGALAERESVEIDQTQTRVWSHRFRDSNKHSPT